MPRAEYTRLLAPQERLMAIKMGMAMTLLKREPAMGLRAFKCAGFEKTSRVPDAWKAMDHAGKLILVVSLLAGAPIGAFAHSAGKSISGETADEKERLRRIQYYRDVSNQLDQGLANTNQ